MMVRHRCQPGGDLPMDPRLSPAVCGALAVSLAPLLLSGGSLYAAPAPTPPTVHAAYVLLAESPAGRTVAFARVIVDPSQACPALLDGAKRTATTPRSNPHGFAVKVC